jgi:hypothetical protein
VQPGTQVPALQVFPAAQAQSEQFAQVSPKPDSQVPLPQVSTQLPPAHADPGPQAQSEQWAQVSPRPSSQIPLPQSDTHRPSTQLPLLQAASVLQGLKGGSELDSTHRSTLQTVLSQQSAFSTQGLDMA